MKNVLGAGIDVVGIGRVESLWLKEGAKLVKRVAAKDPDAEGDWTAGKLARRWALKEAVSKALGTGIGQSYGFEDIMVGHTSRGAPTVVVKGVKGFYRFSYVRLHHDPSQ